MFIATSIIMSGVNSECSRLWEYAQKAVKSQNSSHHLFVGSQTAAVRLKRQHNWLAISVYYLAINTQSQ